MAKRPRRDRTEVSCIIKYLVFGFNVVFWLIGGAVAAVGIWAWSEKEMFANIGRLTEISFDPALIFIIAGAIMFFIGFAGCVGALRENTILLLFYIVAIGILFCAQIVAGVLAFVYKEEFSVAIGAIFFFKIGVVTYLFVRREEVKDQIQKQLLKVIVVYREDPDLQNLIDWVQADWLKCCGVKDFNDWNDNIYFNCSSPSVERCGVPFSCCIPDPNSAIENRQCGYATRDPQQTPQPDQIIYTAGCVAQGEQWLNSNLIPVAGVAVAVALIQILGICFAQNLRSDIFAQKSKWQMQ